MPDPISWYALGRDVSDPQTILEAVDEKILSHNLDPSAHGQSDEAVYNHRISTLLDHVNYSIYNIKLHPETRPIKAFVDAGGAAEFTDINSAINYVNALGGGRIFVKPGTYSMNSDVNLYSNINIEGEDRDTVIFDFNGGFYGFIASGLTNVHLHNIKIDNIQITNSSNWENGAILFSYVDDADIINTKLVNNYYEPETSGAGIILANCTQTNLKNNYLSYSAGVIVTNGGNNIYIEDNYFTNIYLTVFYVNAATQVVFRHNFLDSNPDDMMDLSWNKIIIDGNIFNVLSSTAIVINGHDNIITNNLFISLAEGSAGISFNGAQDNCIVSNNRFIGSFSHAIYVSTGDGNVIANNISESAESGIIISANGNYNSITGNVMRGCGTPISNSGTGNQLSGNVI
jgi:hypothetical protein